MNTITMQDEIDRKKLLELSEILIKGKEKGIKNFTKEDAELSIVKYFRDILGTEKLTYSFLHSRKNRENLEKCFAVIEEIMTIRLETGILSNPFFARFVDYKKIDFGDIIQFNVKTPNSLLVTTISDGNWYINRQRFDGGQTYTIPTKDYACKVYAEFSRLLANLVSFTEMVDNLYTAMLEQMQEDVALQFMNIFDVIPADFKHQGNYEAEELTKIISKVQTANRNNPPIICGTKLALSKIVNGYNATNSFFISNEMKNEINENGVLRVWNGVSLIEIPQSFKKGTSEFLLPDDVLYVISGETKPIKVVQEGNTLSNYRSEFDTHDRTLEYSLIQRFGVGVILDSFIGAYKIV